MNADKSRVARLADRLERPGYDAQKERDTTAAAAELRRLEASEAALLAALKSAHVRCPSKEFDRWRALIEATEEVRNNPAA